jgi:hypothetical protein
VRRQPLREPPRADEHAERVEGVGWCGRRGRRTRSSRSRSTEASTETMLRACARHARRAARPSSRALRRFADNSTCAPWGDPPCRVCRLRTAKSTQRAAARCPMPSLPLLGRKTRHAARRMRAGVV